MNVPVITEIGEPTKPRLLDLFSGAGGAARGYQEAGFHVTGIDHRPQPRYAGDAFVQADALDYLRQHGREFDAIHSSPPCQRYSCTMHIPGRDARAHPDLIAPVRAALVETGRPYVIENVVGAPLCQPILLCGVMFGLRVFRHRLFESSCFLLPVEHTPHGDRRIGRDGFCCVVGHGDANWGKGRHQPKEYRRLDMMSRAMGIDWMTRAELTQAIPPAYSRFLGAQLLRWVGGERSAA